MTCHSHSSAAICPPKFSSKRADCEISSVAHAIHSFFSLVAIVRGNAQTDDDSSKSAQSLDVVLVCLELVAAGGVVVATE